MNDTTEYDDRAQARHERLLKGYWQFGCDGRHRGNGSPDCPREPHHHHDWFCAHPSLEELARAGIKHEDFRASSRAGA